MCIRDRYNIVQTTNDIKIPIGIFRFGFLVSCAAVLTASKPVSYTHLEDYSKIRENDHISIIGLKDFQPGKPLTAVLPVSYTHLDVYKRQTVTYAVGNTLLIIWGVVIVLIM